MTLTRCAAAALVLTLAGLAGTPTRASAAWDNVFQVCCHDCNRPCARLDFGGPCPHCDQPVTISDIIEQRR